MVYLATLVASDRSCRFLSPSLILLRVAANRKATCSRMPHACPCWPCERGCDTLEVLIVPEALPCEPPESSSSTSNPKRLQRLRSSQSPRLGLCPLRGVLHVTRQCMSLDEPEGCINALQDELDVIRAEARRVFASSTGHA